MINRKWHLAIGFLVCLISLISFADAIDQLAAGTYNGIVQEFNDPNTSVAGDILDAGEFLVEEDGSLNLTTLDGADVRFQWKQDHWFWEYSETGKAIATPRRVGVFYVVEYVAFENEERVGHAQFFLARQR